MNIYYSLLRLFVVAFFLGITVNNKANAQTLSLEKSINLIADTTITRFGAGQNGKIPNFVWDIPPGKNRLLIYFFHFERDHRPNLGSNWPGTSKDDAPEIAIWGKRSNSKLSESAITWLDANDYGDGSKATFSNHMNMHWFLEEHNLNTGPSLFNFSNINLPQSSADEMSLTILVYENVSQSRPGGSLVVDNTSVTFAARKSLNSYHYQPTTLLGSSAEDILYLVWASTSSNEKFTVEPAGWNLLSALSTTNNAGEELQIDWATETSEADGISSAIFTGHFSAVPSATVIRESNVRVQSFFSGLYYFLPAARPSLSGSVLNQDNIGTNGGGLYVNVLDGNNRVVATTAVQSDGNFLFPTGGVLTERDTCILQLTKTMGVVGNVAPNTELNIGWRNYYESYEEKMQAPFDGLLNLVVGTDYIYSARFGVIEDVPMSLNILDFTATKVDYEALLAWTSNYRDGIKEFELERSAEGRNWTTIGWVNTKKNYHENSKYSFVDNSPNLGKNYYRIKQTNLEGGHDYSPIRVLDFKELGSAVKVYPHPVANTLTISGLKGSETIYIYNALGQCVKEVKNAIAEQKIDMSALAASVYNVLITNEQGKQIGTYKIVKQDL